MLGSRAEGLASLFFSKNKAELPPVLCLPPIGVGQVGYLVTVRTHVPPMLYHT